MSDQYLSDRQRIARTLMNYSPHEPLPGQQAGALEALSVTAPYLFGLSRLGGTARAALPGQMRASPPIQPRSPGYTPMEVGIESKVTPEQTMEALRFIISNGAYGAAR